MISIQDMSRVIISMEKKLNLFDLSISGIPVWWFARDRVLAYLFKLKNGINMTASSSESLSKLEIFKKLIDSFHINGIKKHNILAVSTSSARRMVADGKDFDVYFDFISWTAFKDDYGLIETPDLSNHSRNQYTPARYYGDYLSLRGNFARRVPSLTLKGHLSELKEICTNICNYLKDNEDLFASESALLDIIGKEVGFAGVSVNIAGKYIDKINPRVLFVECGYSPSHMAFQISAKKRNIPVIEIQHGLIVPDSLGYFFGLKDRAQLKESPFPDKIIVFGHHFNKILQKNPFIDENMVIVHGHPILYAMKEKYQSNIKINGRIVISTQPELQDFFIKMISELSKKTKNEIIIKPHPSELSRIRKLYDGLESLGNVSIVPANTFLYKLFAQAEFHISAASMTHLEALCFGLKDIIIDSDSFLGYYEFLKDMGLPVANNVEELIQRIEDYPNIDNIVSYVQSDIFTLNKNPMIEMEELLRQYLF